MKKLLLACLCSIIFISSLHAQKDVYLTITHKLGNSNFAFNQQATNDLGQNFTITRVDYYISSIKIIHDGGMETNASGKYILAKGTSNVNELLGSFNVTNVEGIKFSIGVESPTNNMDPNQWPPNHPLFFQSPSMHWGWSSGYRFVALEGKAGSSLNTTYEMHGLWNANYFEQTQMAIGVNSGNDVYIYLDADFVEALRGINVQAGPIDHGTNATDLTMLHNFRDYVFSPGSGTTGISDINDLTDIDIYPVPAVSSFYIDNSGSDIIANRVMIMDALGKIVMDRGLDQLVSQIHLSTKGVYTVVIFNDETILGRKRVLIQ